MAGVARLYLLVCRVPYLEMLPGRLPYSPQQQDVIW